MVALSEDEHEQLQAAAEREGMALAAWIGDVALRASAARDLPDPAGEHAIRTLATTRAELTLTRRMLGSAVDSLANVARTAERTGTLHPAAAHVLGHLEQSLAAIDAVVRTLEEISSAIRRRQPS